MATSGAFARPGGESAVFDDAGAMIDGGGLDSVILSTPIPTTADLTLRALAAGSHVLLEKPPVVSLDEHLRVVDAAAPVGAGRLPEPRLRGGSPPAAS